MTNDEILRYEIVILWLAISDEDRADLLDHARWLAHDSRLKGGPFDGMKVPDQFKNKLSLSIEWGGRAACYGRDNNLMLCFSGLRRIGGEGGEWPDIKAKQLFEMGVHE